MSHPIRHILRFLFAAAVVATLAILIIRGRDPSFLNFHRPSLGEAALDRQIGRVDFQMVPVKDAIEQLGSRAGIHIQLDDSFLKSRVAEGSFEFSVDHVTLGEALGQIFYYQTDGEVSYFSEGDRIRLSGRAASAPRYVGEYPLKDFAGDSTPTIRGHTFSWPSLVGYGGNLAALELLAPGDVAPYDRLAFCPPHLLIVATESAHLEFEKVFRALRPGASVEALRSLSPTTELFDLFDGKIISRDRYLASSALRSTFSTFKIPLQTFEESLSSAGKQAGVRIILDETDRWLPYPKVMLDAKQITLATAIDRLLAQLSSHRGYFSPEADTVRVSFLGRNPYVIRIYNLDSWFAEVSAVAREQAMERLIRDVDCIDDIPTTGSSVNFLGPNLVVHARWSDQERVQAALVSFVNGKPPDHSTASQ
jgi:hypothetical protein